MGEYERKGGRHTGNWNKTANKSKYSGSTTCSKFHWHRLKLYSVDAAITLNLWGLFCFVSLRIIMSFCIQTQLQKDCTHYLSFTAFISTWKAFMTNYDTDNMWSFYWLCVCLMGECYCTVTPWNIGWLADAWAPSYLFSPWVLVHIRAIFYRLMLDCSSRRMTSDQGLALSWELLLELEASLTGRDIERKINNSFDFME